MVNNVSNFGKTLEDVSIPVAQRTSTRDLGQQDFLKIMIEQLKGQNPLEGGDSSDFFNQMVQFQSLEAMQAMTKAITQLTEVSSLANAASLVGKGVFAMVPAPEGTPGMLPGQPQEVAGTVVSVMFGNEVTLLLDNGRTIPADTIVSVG
ncbi:MAG: flagellar hook capping FlgD N-terminal domain-containing protein [Dehalococcoidia bacterium]|nr:flagellar hook capping FlgD N-terminal domain-containing protein [Dehalococcoidia bacterium]